MKKGILNLLLNKIKRKKNINNILIKLKGE